MPDEHLQHELVVGASHHVRGLATTIAPKRRARAGGSLCQDDGGDVPLLYRTMARSSTSTARSVGTRRLLHLLLATLFVVPTSAVFIDFTNCLSQSYQDDTPIQLQFVPKYVDAKFDTHNSTHALSVTVYGNVTGQTGNTAVPGANDTEYWNSNSTIQGGKIEDIYDANTKVLTTLFEKVDVLTYEPWNDNLDFCDQVRNGECPLGPIFDIANA